jgi:hypothetical protein
VSARRGSQRVRWRERRERYAVPVTKRVRATRRTLRYTDLSEVAFARASDGQLVNLLAHEEIRSVGPDGRESTDDDIVLDSRDEGRRVRLWGGCYHLIPALSTRRDIGRGFRLDTVMDELGIYSLTPNATGLSGWFPLGDSALVFWTHSDRRVEWWAELRGDTAVGRVHGWNETGRMVALAGPCGS